MNDFGDSQTDAYASGRRLAREAIETGELSHDAARKLVRSSFITTLWIAVLVSGALLIFRHWHVLPALGLALAIWWIGGFISTGIEAWLFGVIHRARARRANNSN